jgi:SAM-dependent methyltransferase
MISGIIHSENPLEHWEHLDCRGKTILDLGCGFWTQAERETGNGTAKYFISQDPIKYIGVDINAADIQRLSKEFPQGVFIEKAIRSTMDILEVLNEYHPSIIKCDIEGMEDALFGLSSSKGILEIGIETHNGRERACLDWLTRVGLTPWRIDSVSFCGEINVIYGKC